jgi:hypothetical protein
MVFDCILKEGKPGDRVESLLEIELVNAATPATSASFVVAVLSVGSFECKQAASRVPKCPALD